MVELDSMFILAITFIFGIHPHFVLFQLSEASTFCQNGHLLSVVFLPDSPEDQMQQCSNWTVAVGE